MLCFCYQQYSLALVCSLVFWRVLIVNSCCCIIFLNPWKTWGSKLRYSVLKKYFSLILPGASLTSFQITSLYENSFSLLCTNIISSPQQTLNVNAYSLWFQITHFSFFYLFLPVQVSFVLSTQGNHDENYVLYKKSLLFWRRCLLGIEIQTWPCFTYSLDSTSLFLQCVGRAMLCRLICEKTAGFFRLKIVQYWQAPLLHCGRNQKLEVSWGH